jgi:hypothetical protein
MVNGTARLVGWLAGVVRWFQAGYIYTYAIAMLLGVLGWDHYQGKAEVITPYFPSSGTGQINVVFPVNPVSAEEGGSSYTLNLKSLKDPAAVYAAGARRL